MTLSKTKIEAIENSIKNSLRKKFQNYKPESKDMPFHYRLLGKDRMALYSFIQSLNTTFGISIYEPVAITLAKMKFKDAKCQYVFGNKISDGAQNVIQHIMNDLTMCKTTNKNDEINKIREVCQSGKTNILTTVKADLFLEDNEGNKFYIDLKTAKPNISNFKDFKRTLLEWCAIELFKNPDAKINSFIAIPYNPYEPKPYERWTLKGMVDLDDELKVANEFWDFLCEKGTYEELLNCFERVGIELRSEIDEYFEKFNK